MSSENIEIPVKKRKLVQIIIVIIILICADILFFLFYHPRKPHSILGYTDSPFFLLELWAFLLLMYFFFKYVKQLFRKGPGLIITKEGIIECVSDSAVGFVSWNDITSINETSELNNKYFSIIVKNPQFYINKQKSRIKRKTMVIRYKIHKTVILIPANRLKITYSDLKELLGRKFNEYKFKSV